MSFGAWLWVVLVGIGTPVFFVMSWITDSRNDSKYL